MAGSLKSVVRQRKLRFIVSTGGQVTQTVVYIFFMEKGILIVA
jgi:hypothetical protein